MKIILLHSYIEVCWENKTYNIEMYNVLGNDEYSHAYLYIHHLA